MSTAVLRKVATVEELRQQILAPAGRSPEWVKKMLQPVADWPTVNNRHAYLVEKTRGQHVLDLGCTGLISAQIKTTAASYHGIDASAGDWIVHDLDGPDPHPVIFPDVTLIVMSELLEHLSNPGRCLDAVKAAYPGRKVYVTVPQAGAYTVIDSCESVNGQHVAYYSMTTLTTLLTRHGFTIEEMRWYHGEPHKAEGIIAVART